MVMSMNWVSSIHSPVWLFFRRSLTASPNSATAVPLGMYRNSGSRVRFPIKMTRLKLAILNSFLPRSATTACPLGSAGGHPPAAAGPPRVTAGQGPHHFGVSVGRLSLWRPSLRVAPAAPPGGTSVTAQAYRRGDYHNPGRPATRGITPGRRLRTRNLPIFPPPRPHFFRGHPFGWHG